MKTILAEKPRIMSITDPAEIASIQRNELNDIIGDSYGDETGELHFWAYAWSVERWRARQLAQNGWVKRG